MRYTKKNVELKNSSWINDKIAICFYILAMLLPWNSHSKSAGTKMEQNMVPVKIAYTVLDLDMPIINTSIL